jgi:hypothetical protein
MLRPTNFLLYYQYPKRMKELSDVPFSLPLVLTYMSSGGEVHNFDINRIPVGDNLAWQVDVGGSSESQPW